MADNVDQVTRSRMMSGIRNKDTAPEMAIRKALHRRGFRYRTHVTYLPGKPDIVLPRFRAVILVHGCFWHGHDCRMFQLPQSRREFWKEKILQNRKRDASVRQGLRAVGWRCLTVWECAIRGPEKRDFAQLIDEVVVWLESSEATKEMRGAEQISR